MIESLLHQNLNKYLLLYKEHIDVYNQQQKRTFWIQKILLSTELN